MTARWRTAEDPTVMPTADFASEVVVRGAMPIGVLDHSGKLAFANPAFQAAGLKTTLLDPRGFLSIARLEQLRVAALREEIAGVAPVFEVPLRDGSIRVEVLGLSLVPGWVALVVHLPGPTQDMAPQLPSPELLLHELRAPLLAIRVALDGLTQECAAQAPDLLGAVGRQSRAVAHLAGVLQGLGDLVRADELAAHRADAPAVDLAGVMGDVLDSYGPLAELSGYQLEIRKDAGVAAIPGDRELLGRALANLIDNALKYSLAPGPIRLGLAQRGALAVLEVADGGPAIAPNDRLRLFEPFVRLQRADVSGVQGSGLGLAVVQRVARAHGGNLSLESAGGSGNTFRLSFLTSGHHRVVAGVADRESR